MLIVNPAHTKPLILTVLLTLGCCQAMANEDILDYIFTDIVFSDQTSERRFQRMQVHLADNRIKEATELAREIVKQNAELSGTHPVRFGKLLANLGILLSSDGFYEEAMTSIDPGLQFIEQKASPFSTTVLQVLMARGLTLTELKAYDLAEESFRRAQHISHRLGGVYNPEQLKIINHITRLNLNQHQYPEADREQNFNLRISEQAYGEDSEELIPVLERLGSYFAARGDMVALRTDAPDFRYTRDSLFRHSLDLYNRAIKIIEKNYGVNDMRLVGPLRGLAMARLLQSTNRSASESALERVLNIVESNPDTDVPDRVMAMIYLGDIYTITGDNRARDLYLRAWKTMSDNPAYDELKAELFGSPTRLHPDVTGVLRLSRTPDAAMEEDVELYINVSYSVKADGRVGKIRLIDKNVPNAQVRYMRAQLSDTRFRPRILDGELIATENLMIHQTFEVIDNVASESNITIDQHGKKSLLTPNNEIPQLSR